MITEENIRQMVTHFYHNVRQDGLLNPIFAAQIRDEEWPHHLERMCDFWSSVLLTTGRFHGNPRAVHAQLADITPEHFDRWLQLFERTLENTFDNETAAGILDRARRMRFVLQSASCPLHV